MLARRVLNGGHKVIGCCVFISVELHKKRDFAIQSWWWKQVNLEIPLKYGEKVLTLMRLFRFVLIEKYRKSVAERLLYLLHFCIDGRD